MDCGAPHKTQRMNGGMNGENFRQVRGKVTGRGSPPRVLTSTNLVRRTLTPSSPRGERAMSLLRLEAPYLPDLKQPPGREPS
ncbi:unnamed protein product [Lasius platythorax]|uniref:Uncharacterized protein n=1 Tax=Lasius platythorax TaxID=488582 RepID=A0AAV2N149_9HYME